MRASADRILTTHCGSLPRQTDLLSELLLEDEIGNPIDRAALDREIHAAVHVVMREQVAANCDIVSDGEQSRPGFSTYLPQRMRGFGGESSRPTPRDIDDFPQFAKLRRQRMGRHTRIGNAPQAVAELSYDSLADVQAECDLLRSALTKAGKPPADAFITSVSPGIIATTMLNAHYESHEAYVFALARELAKEYRCIAQNGFVLQIDCPDLGMERARLYKDKSDAEFIRAMETHIEGINLAIEGIPKENIRLHCCWGNWEGPHTHDVPLAALLPLMYRAKVGALSIEFANPRHQHEYDALRSNPLPDTMLLIPGVIDTTTNFVEHPQVVANRIGEAVAVVGDRTRVIAGTDCGFGTSAGTELVARDVVWAKMRACSEGAAIASRKLWGRGA
jgi:5-methyltetrahydropteroyltriglutamate--homocysteine methyltransferase